jgi:hypothetical protein
MKYLISVRGAHLTNGAILDYWGAHRAPYILKI